MSVAQDPGGGNGSSVKAFLADVEAIKKFPETPKLVSKGVTPVFSPRSAINAPKLTSIWPTRQRIPPASPWHMAWPTV